MKNLTNKMVTIEGVAILFYGIVYSLPKPYRHHHIIRLLAHEIRVRNLKHDYFGTEGFLTSEGKFVNRHEALDIFIAAKQEFIDPYIYSSGLYSENCWGTPGKWNGEPGSQERQIFEYNENPEVIESLLNIKKE